MLVGPNDGGKSAIVDAIRLVVGTTTRETNRIAEDDLHYGASGQVSSLRIACRFGCSSPAEAWPFFEQTTPEKSGSKLQVRVCDCSGKRRRASRLE